MGGNFANKQKDWGFFLFLWERSLTRQEIPQRLGIVMTAF